MEDVEKYFRNSLKKKGLRCTPERLAILRQVIAVKGHFEAEDIFIRLRRKKISRASVYRTLSLLVEAGIVRKTPCDFMEARYEPVFGLQHHDHLVCLQCGQIIEFRDHAIETRIEQTARNHRFRLKGHRLILSGYCDKCR
jgi:Fur family ferric uptake transcriptional regulator